MRKNRGFKLGHKLVKIFKWAIHRRKKTRTNLHLNPPPIPAANTISKICNWGRNLRLGARELCFPKSKSGYVRLGRDPIEGEEKVCAPKGHLAVYVGEKEDDTCRYLVPVIYFNHPLFGELLREAEKKFGHDHPGGIQIPCQVSEFEKVRTRIAASGGGGGFCRMRRSWKLRS